MDTKYFLKTSCFFLFFLTIISFFLGFYFGENSAGAGGLDGDFKNTWKNLNTFLNYDIRSSLDFIKEGNREFYISSRTPVLYILNAKLNPFTYSINAFILSIFIFSLISYFIFFVTLLKKYKNTDKTLLLLLSCVILISPYFRTSGFWGSEENYGIFSTILAFLFFNSFNETNKSSYLFLFLTIFFSSLSVYLDQKLIIIPLIIFIDIFFFNNFNKKVKFFTFLTYIIFSIPFLYFIYSWKSLIPAGDSIARGFGQKFSLYHPIYVSTIIALYLIPLLNFKENLITKIKTFHKNKVSLTLFLSISVYLLILFFLSDLNVDTKYSKGATFKLIYILFENSLLKKFLITFVSFFSFFIIIIFSEKITHLIFFFFLLISSIFVYPILQEYYDPLIIIVILLYFFEAKSIRLNFTNVIILFFYLVLFLISANLYYQF